MCARIFSAFRRVARLSPGATRRVCDFQFHESLIYTLEEEHCVTSRQSVNNKKHYGTIRNTLYLVAFKQPKSLALNVDKQRLQRAHRSPDTAVSTRHERTRLEGERAVKREGREARRGATVELQLHT